MPSMGDSTVTLNHLIKGWCLDYRLAPAPESALSRGHAPLRKLAVKALRGDPVSTRQTPRSSRGSWVISLRSLEAAR